MSPEFAEVLFLQHAEHMMILKQLEINAFTTRELHEHLNACGHNYKYMRVWTLLHQMEKKGMLLKDPTERHHSYRYYSNPTYDPTQHQY